VDFAAWLETYEGPTFNFIQCDFPYGINADKMDQSSAAGFGGYADTPDAYWDLLRLLERAMDKVVDESSHLMFWFTMDYYHETKCSLERMGWRVSPFPLIWHKSDNTGILPDPRRGPRRIYETAFIGSRNDRHIVKPVSNLFSCGGRDKAIHMNEKPQQMLTYFMGMFVDEYSRVLDPTCGSANALKAATALGAKTVLGLEIDTEFYNRTIESYFGEDNDL
jgi:hypothetical protein